MSSRITKTQKYAIYWLNHQKKSSLDIADELKLTEKQVTNVLEKYTPTIIQQENISTESQPAQKISPKDLMITHTSAKKTNSVSIMTKEASELNDAMRKTMNNSNSTANDQQRGIFRLKK